jgi:fucose 4-O-acetylase-like acetyltransferase
MRERDYSLDLIKGIACLLMVFAHVPVGQNYWNKPGGSIVGLISFVGGLAPVLFFAVTGVTSSFQSKKNIKVIIIFYILFGVLGLSYNSMWRPNFYDDFVGDVPQVIALSVIVLISLEKYIKPGKIFYLLLAIGIFLIHFSITRYVSPFPLKQLLFAPGIFTLFPWLSLFMLGLFFYKSDRFSNLTIALVLAAIMIVMGIVRSVNLDYFNKFDMSIGYFLISSSAMTLVFFLSKSIPFHNSKNPILYLGKNSFLFLYVHLLVIAIVSKVSQNTPVLWAVVAVSSYIIMIFLQFINKYIERYFYRCSTWAIIIALITINPLIIKNYSLLFALQTLIGLLFSLNYTKLFKVIEGFSLTGSSNIANNGYKKFASK